MRYRRRSAGTIPRDRNGRRGVCRWCRERSSRRGSCLQSKMDPFVEEYRGILVVGHSEFCGAGKPCQHNLPRRCFPRRPIRLPPTELVPANAYERRLFEGRSGIVADPALGHAPRMASSGRERQGRHAQPWCRIGGCATRAGMPQLCALMRSAVEAQSSIGVGNALSPPL
jgi:hypothetical protein